VFDTSNGIRWSVSADFPPYGYKNARDDQNKPIIVPNEKAATVKKIFLALAKGKTQSEIREALRKNGVSIPRATFSIIVRNRVYIGEIHV
jgi:site-specific DNA recombinase